jgi:hypothetical protein
VKLLMGDPRVNPAVRGNVAIIVASGQGNHSILEMLTTDSGVSPATFDNDAIKSAAQKWLTF